MTSIQETELRRLYKRYFDLNKRYEESIVWNHNGTRVENESFGLKRATSRAYNIFYNYFHSIGYSFPENLEWVSEYNDELELEYKDLNNIF